MATARYSVSGLLASSSDPQAPATGSAIYFNTTTGRMRWWDPATSTWQQIPRIFTQTTAPTSGMVTGDEWNNTS